jgi:hypothetical protein
VNWNIEYVEAQNYIKITGEGVFSIEDHSRVFQDILANEHWEPGIPILFDNRNLDFGVTNVSIIKRASDNYSRVSNRLGNGKTAMLMKSLIDFGRGRQFEMLSEEKCQMNMCIFLEEEKAISWLVSENQKSAFHV